MKRTVSSSFFSYFIDLRLIIIKLVNFLSVERMTRFGKGDRVEKKIFFIVRSSPTGKGFQKSGKWRSPDA